MVSASRKAGRTEWVHLTATVAGKFSFTVPDDAAGWGAVAPRSRPSSVKVSRSTKNESSWSVTLAAGKSVALWPAGEPQPTFIIAPLAGNPKEFNYWGYNHDMLPLHTDDDASTARDATDDGDNMPCCDDNSLPMYGSTLKFEDGSNISSHMICHHIKTDDDRAHHGLKTDDRGVAAQMAAQTLTGNWTSNVTQAKGSISHIEIWQTGTELYLRTTAWGASPSTGSVDPVAMTATVQMVGGSAKVAKIENNYSWLAFTGCPGNCWCKFPHCPMPPPARWPPFPPAAGTGWLTVPAYPPLAPPFPQTWQLNRSTIIHTSNLSGWSDATSAAKYGIVSFDCE
jgi:hypothetical protein